MGITKINPLLKQLCPHIFRNIYLSQLSGCRIAIDVSILFIAYWSPSLKMVLDKTNLADEEPDRDLIIENWIDMVVNFMINKMLSKGIIPVLVFDGKPPQKKEDHARKKRKEDRIKAQNELARKKYEISQIDPLYRTKEMNKDMYKLYAKVSFPNPKEDYAKMREIFSSLGIPCLQATGEAEELCSYLCRNNYVNAVYSKDTDNYVHACPYLITNLDTDYKNKDVKATISMVSEILQSLNITYEEFVDLCILLGCDYNKKLRGVGPENTYKLISQYRRIPYLPDKYDKTELNYIDCYNIFYPGNKTYESLCVNPDYKLLLDLNAINTMHETLNKYGQPKIIDSIKFIYKSFQLPSTDFKDNKIAYIIAENRQLYNEMPKYTGGVNVYEGQPQFFNISEEIDLSNINLSKNINVSNIDLSNLTIP